MRIVYFNEKNDIIDKIVNRGEIEFEKFYNSINQIINEVKNRKDKAIIDFTEKFDNFKLNENNYFFDKNDFEKAYNSISKELKEALNFAADRIKKYHEKQKKNSWIATEENGIIIGQKFTPIERIGIYVPGGKALYPSTLLMTAIPAKVADVKEIFVTCPVFEFEKALPVLAAAHISGVDKIFKIGGAQSIAALAFGTDWFPKVYKIVGPGNIYVAMAKKILFGIIDIDMFAGPSEILIISDGSVNPEYVANDLLSQAEHDELASAILITHNEDFAKKVKKIIDEEIKKSPRKDILENSIKNYSVIIIVNNLDKAVDIANEVAPEHLEILTDKPFSILGKVKNAGAIFLGKYSPEPIGDYVAGTNHVLPTGGTAKFFSPLSVDDFIKKSSIVYVPETAYSQLSKNAKIIAKEEGLIHHHNSLEVRDEG